MSRIRNLPFVTHPRLQGYLRKLLMPLGIDFYLEMDDRRVLETRILPYLRDNDAFARVLFVGCDWYTRGYRKFFADETYWTLDMNPGQRAFGARQHVTDSVCNVARHFPANALDVIVCNGVYGYGLDALPDFETAMAGCRTVLRPGGLFLLGWDDNPQRRPFPLADSAELARFERFVFPPLDTDHYLTANAGRHTFDFFVKRPDGALQ